jgi:hypothetical protein
MHETRIEKEAEIYANKTKCMNTNAPCIVFSSF